MPAKPKPGRPELGRTERAELRLEPALMKLVRASAERRGGSLNDWFRAAAHRELASEASIKVKAGTQVRLGEPDDEVTRGD